MIDILMATHNGEKYLSEQLESILEQTYKDWRLIIADDCSSDSTVDIIRRYCNKFPKKICYYCNNKPSGSAKNNFFKLFRYIENDYFMLADQDDVWLKNKIESTMDKMKSMESIYGKNVPILVHTDLKVVDYKLNLINSSLFYMQKMNYRRDKLNNILVNNIVTGCTVMANRSLATYLYEIPKFCVMHDMWLALIATSFGRIGFVNKATILYRQHSNNAEGAKNLRSAKYVLSKIFDIKNIKKQLRLQYNQAGEFLRIYYNLLPEYYKIILLEYSKFEEKSFITKFITLNKYNLFKRLYLQCLLQIFL